MTRELFDGLLVLAESAVLPGLTIPPAALARADEVIQ
jgi:hypothetical protein